VRRLVRRPPTSGFRAGRAGAAEGLRQRRSMKASADYAAAGTSSGATMSRVRDGSILMPGPIVDATVIEWM
jgi:hypothetical protein